MNFFKRRSSLRVPLSCRTKQSKSYGDRATYTHDESPTLRERQENTRQKKPCVDTRKYAIVREFSEDKRTRISIRENTRLSESFQKTREPVYRYAKIRDTRHSTKLLFLSSNLYLINMYACCYQFYYQSVFVSIRQFAMKKHFFF